MVWEEFKWELPPASPVKYCIIRVRDDLRQHMFYNHIEDVLQAHKHIFMPAIMISLSLIAVIWYNWYRTMGCIHFSAKHVIHWTEEEDR